MKTDEKLDLILQELRIIIKSLKNKDDRAPAFMNVAETAKFLKLSVPRIYELIYSKKLMPHQHKKYHRLLFHPDTLNQYLNENSKT